MAVTIQRVELLAIHTQQFAWFAAYRAIPLRCHHITAFSIMEMRVPGSDAGIQHRPADLLPQRTVGALRCIGLDHAARLVDQCALAGIAPQPLETELLVFVAQRFDLETGQPGRHEPLQAVFQEEFLIQRHAFQTRAFCRQAPDAGQQGVSCRVAAIIIGRQLVQFDQHLMAVRRAIGLQLIRQVLDQHGIGHRLIETHAHHFAYLGAHILVGQITRTGMRIARAVGIDTTAPQVAEARAGASNVVAQVAIQGHRIAAIRHVVPMPHTGREWQLVALQYAFLFQCALEHAAHRGQAQRRADGHEQRHIELGRIQFAQHFVGDHRTLAVGDDDERPAARLQALQQAALHRLAPRLVEEEIVDVLQQGSRHHAQQDFIGLVEEPALARALHRRGIGTQLVQHLVQQRVFFTGVGQGIGQFTQVLACRCDTQGTQHPLFGLVEGWAFVTVATAGNFRRGVAFAVDPVGQAGALAHATPEQRFVPLATQDFLRGLVANAMDEDDRLGFTLRSGHEGGLFQCPGLGGGFAITRLCLGFSSLCGSSLGGWFGGFAAAGLFCCHDHSPFQGKTHLRPLPGQRWIRVMKPC